MGTKREYGVDAMRIFAMLLVIIGHIVGRGGVLDASESTGSPQHYAALFLKIFAEYSINIFGLISGYVGYGKKWKPVRMIELWLRVVFWTTVISSVFMLLGWAEISPGLVKSTFLPVVSKTYWYVTAYVIVCLVSPMLNFVVERIPDVILCVGLIASVAGLSVIITTSGNNAVWLVILYLIGAAVKKNGKEAKYSVPKGVIGFYMCVFLTFVAVVFQERGIVTWNRYTWAIWGGRSDGLWPSSITMVLASISVLFVGIHLKTGEKTNKILKKCTPLILSVYLIHVHPLVFGAMEDAFTGLAHMHWILEVIGVVSVSLVIFVVCLFLDYWRERVFALVERKVKILIGKL